jgi:hypothetical protein
MNPQRIPTPRSVPYSGGMTSEAQRRTTCAQNLCRNMWRSRTEHQVMHPRFSGSPSVSGLQRGQAASIPKIPIKTWERVQRLDWACLYNASIDTDRTDQERFYATIDCVAEAYAASKDSATGVVSLLDVWPFYDTSGVFRVTTHLPRVVFTTQQYVEYMSF